MLIAKIDQKKTDPALLKKAADVLKSGGLAVYPTETAYALGCDPRNAKAVKKLFAAKARDTSKPLPIIVASVAMAARFLNIDRYGRILANAFWPGPLTIVGAPRVRLASGVVSDKKEIALRVSPHPVAQALSRALGGPIVSTSANRSGHATLYDISAVIADLGPLPDVLLDAGPLRRAQPSTIVRARNGIVEILREGPVTEEAIHRALMKHL